MEKTGRAFCVCADWKVMDYFHVVRNTMFSLAQQDIMFAKSNSEILCISAAGQLPETEQQNQKRFWIWILKPVQPTQKLMSHSSRKSICPNRWFLPYMPAFNKMVNNYSFKCYLELYFKEEKKRCLFWVQFPRGTTARMFFPKFGGPWHFLPYEIRVIFYVVLFFLMWLKHWFTENFISPLFSIQNWCFQISTQHPEKTLKCYGNKDMNTLIKGKKVGILNLLNILSSFVSKVKDWWWNPFYT